MYTNICMYIQKGHARTTRVCVVIFERERERAQSFETTCTTHTTYTNIHTCTHTHIHTHISIHNIHMHTHTTRNRLGIAQRALGSLFAHCNTQQHPASRRQHAATACWKAANVAACCCVLQCAPVCTIVLHSPHNMPDVPCNHAARSTHPHIEGACARVKHTSIHSLAIRYELTPTCAHPIIGLFLQKDPTQKECLHKCVYICISIHICTYGIQSICSISRLCAFPLSSAGPKRALIPLLQKRQKGGLSKETFHFRRVFMCAWARITLQIYLSAYPCVFTWSSGHFGNRALRVGGLATVSRIY